MFLPTVLAFLLLFSNNLAQSEVNFICKSGHVLDGIQKVCDGRADCYDTSDEAIELCSHTLCPSNHAKCKYGACIPRSKFCNGVRDCFDSSDELNCGRKWNSCNPTEFNCGDNGEDASYNYCIDSSKICDGIVDCANGADENKTICENDLCPENSFRCKYGGCVPTVALCNHFFDCLDGSDESVDICLHIKCPECSSSVPCTPFDVHTISSKRVTKKCKWNDQQMPCTQNILPGTRVDYVCKDHFRPKTAKDAKNNWNVCQADGRWLRDFLQCKPECGRLSAGIPLIANGWKLSETMPWHASIFLNDNSSQPKFICGATLISESVIITAAHCVRKFKANDLSVGVGNLNAEYMHPDDYFARYSAVKQIIVHPNYLNQLNSYESDIALIELCETIEIDEIISPICLYPELDDIMSNPAEQTLGIMVGLGMMENFTSSSSLRASRMPIIATEKCIEKVPLLFRRFISFTNFCAGWGNGTSACNGDSGSGLAIKRSDDRYYLEGIVSVSPRRKTTENCDPKQPTIFTKVGIYAKWIENHLNQINENSEQ